MMAHRGALPAEKVNLVEGPKAAQQAFVALFGGAGVKGKRRAR